MDKIISFESERFIIPFVEYFTSVNEIYCTYPVLWNNSSYIIENIFPNRFGLEFSNGRMIIRPHLIKWDLCKITNYGSIQSCSFQSEPINLSDVNFQIDGNQYSSSFNVEPNDFVIEVRFNREKDTAGTIADSSEMPNPLFFITYGRRDYLGGEKYLSFPEKDPPGNWIFRPRTLPGNLTKSVR